MNSTGKAEIYQSELSFDSGTEKAVLPTALSSKVDALKRELETFEGFGTRTQVLTQSFGDAFEVPVFINEFWTAKQRQGSRLHEISYRACFKPQLPLFFIERFTKPGDTVYDPFMGRGTTLLEAALNGRKPIGCDINPVSSILIEPRLRLPPLKAVEKRLAEIDFLGTQPERTDLLTFYHPETLVAISSLRAYLLKRSKSGEIDAVDKWIQMVATNRLTGHSTGFFSVYSLPPNQAVTVQSQQRINEKRQQVPPFRDVPAIILKKSRQLLNISAKEKHALEVVATDARFITGSCNETAVIADGSVDLIVTSPPFLNEVDYQTDNWLRCWFNGIDAEKLPIWIVRKPQAWQERMTSVFEELRRVLRPCGHIAFEVGEVRKGKIKLEEWAVQAGTDAGLKPELILINSQIFTKTSNCWGVDNQSKGTNTNRIVVFSKP